MAFPETVGLLVRSRCRERALLLHDHHDGSECVIAANPQPNAGDLRRADGPPVA
jgi:hypothetical protein